MNRFRILMWGLCLTAGVLAGGLVLWTTMHPRSGALPSSPPVARAAVGGPFQLVNQDGRPVDEGLLRGRWSVVFFGYTYCPDFCPATLQMLAQAQEQLGPQGRDLQVVFVSVDPQRDTPAQVRAYVTGTTMPRNTVGLTGTPAQVAAAARAYRVYYGRDGAGENYTVNHSTAAYLMNPQGQFSRVLAYGLTPEQTAGQIRDAMRARG